MNVGNIKKKIISHELINERLYKANLFRIQVSKFHQET